MSKNNSGMHVVYAKHLEYASNNFFFTGSKREREDSALRYLCGPFLFQSPVETGLFYPLSQEAYLSMQYLDDSHAHKGNKCPGPDFGSDQYGIGIEITTAQAPKEAQQQKLIVDAIDRSPSYVENDIRQHDKKHYFSKSDFLDIPNTNLLAIGLKETDPYYEIERAVKRKLKKLDSYKPFNEQWLVVITPYPLSCINAEELAERINNCWSLEGGFGLYCFIFLNSDAVIIK